MEALEQIMGKERQKTFPNQGVCRVPGCEVAYTRDGDVKGRKGMCSTHYNETLKLIKEERVTWDDVDTAWPDVKPYPYFGPGSGLDKIKKVVSEIHIDQIRLSETEFRNEVMRLMHENGHGVWQLDPQRQRSIPDLLIVTKSGKALFRELKAVGGSLSEGQETKIPEMLVQGADVAVWEPIDLENGRILNEVSE